MFGKRKGLQDTILSGKGKERSIQASASGQGVQRALALWRGSGPALGPVRLGGATGLRAGGQGAGTGRLSVEPRNGPRSAACPPAKRG